MYPSRIFQSTGFTLEAFTLTRTFPENIFGTEAVLFTSTTSLPPYLLIWIDFIMFHLSILDNKLVRLQIIFINSNCCSQIAYILTRSVVRNASEERFNR